MDLQERFYCACCDVVFKEQFPKYMDVTPCIRCDCTSVCLSDVRYGLGLSEKTICELYDL